MSEIKNGEPVETFIIQVAALSWAATQVPEITVAIQSFPNAGFLSAVQVELLFMIVDLHPVTKAARFQSFRNSVPKHALTRYCWRNTEPKNATDWSRSSFLTAEIDEEIHALCEARSKNVPYTNLQRVPPVVC
jgi:hypothetical protein